MRVVSKFIFYLLQDGCTSRSVSIKYMEGKTRAAPNRSPPTLQRDPNNNDGRRSFQLGASSRLPKARGWQLMTNFSCAGFAFGAALLGAMPCLKSARDFDDDGDDDLHDGDNDDEDDDDDDNDMMLLMMMKTMMIM